VKNWRELLGAAPREIERPSADSERLIAGAYRVGEPPLTWAAALAAERATELAPVREPRRLPRRLVAGGVAAAVLAVAVGLPLAMRGGPESVNAQELLQKGENASAIPQGNVHIVSVSRSGSVETRTESWYSEDGRARTETVSTLEDGSVIRDGTTVLEGEMWMWNESGAGLVVAHGPRLIEIGQAVAPSINEQLESWSRGGCYRAAVTGKEQVAGRATTLIEVTATPDTCPYDSKKLARSRLWIDVETNQFLKMEFEGPDGVVNSGFTVTSYDRYAEGFGDEVFRYVPPAGIEVREFDTYGELKGALIPLVPRGSAVTLEEPKAAPANE